MSEKMIRAVPSGHKTNKPASALIKCSARLKATQAEHSLRAKKDVKVQLVMARFALHKYWMGNLAVQFMLTLFGGVMSPDHFG